MRALLVLGLLTSGIFAAAAEPVNTSVRVCIKWSREIPEAVAAGAGVFASVTRVDEKGPYLNCDVVVATESFGVGWLMSAWMKEAVFSPCGRRLGGFKFRYKGDQWQVKVVTGLHRFLTKHPEVILTTETCEPPSEPAS